MRTKIRNGAATNISTAILRLTFLIITIANGLVFSQQISDALRVSRQGLQFNARALSLGNAYSTIGNDFSALRFNPATMALSDKAGYTVTWITTAFKSSSDYYGTHTEFTTTSTPTGQIGLTLPFRLGETKNLAIGMGYTQSKDFDLGYKYAGLNGGSLSFTQVLAERADPTARALGLSYPAFDASGNYLGDHTVLGPNMYEQGYLLDEGGLKHYSFGLSVEAVHNIFFGISGSYNSGHYTSDLELSVADVNDAYPAGVLTVPGEAQTEGFVGADLRIVRNKQYQGWDVRFGTLFKLANFIGVSASFKVPSSHKVDEVFFVRGMSQFASNRSLAVPETESTSLYHFTPPSELTVGGMVNLWIITGTAEATYVDYSTMKITSGVGDLPDQTEINKRIQEELSAVLNLNAGAEFRLPFTGLSARAGGIYQPSPYGEDSSRYGQKFLTAGVGINSSNMFHFDVGYAYGWRGENKNQQTDNDSGSEQTIAYHNLLFTLKFTP
ncbi:MAG: hypothetical protein ACREOO_25810 [bacterium]